MFRFFVFTIALSILLYMAFTMLIGCDQAKQVAKPVLTPITEVPVTPSYYPAEIGNIWVLELSDGEAWTTYTIEGPEIINGEEHILLKVKTEALSTSESQTDQYFLTVGTEAIHLHRIILEDDIATLSASFSTPVVFFPLQLELGDMWQIAERAEVTLEIGLSISGQRVTDLEVVAFEDVDTPVGTFQNCAKVRSELQISTGGLSLETTSYQWLAPNVGPVQYENSDGLLFRLTSSNLLNEK